MTTGHEPAAIYLAIYVPTRWDGPLQPTGHRRTDDPDGDMPGTSVMPACQPTSAVLLCCWVCCCRQLGQHVLLGSNFYFTAQLQPEFSAHTEPQSPVTSHFKAGWQP